MTLPKIHPLGDSALTVEFGETMDAGVLARVRAFDVAFAALQLPGVIETVPTYRSVTLHLDPETVDLGALHTAVSSLAEVDIAVPPCGRLWRVPVTYGGDHGIDIDVVADHAGLTMSQVIERHSGTDYTVAMVGFLPGFSYLAGLDASLAVPRRASPRAEIPASSISIGGQQTAIGSLPGPSGWHLIGRTPVRPFKPGRTPEVLFQPGDRIRFRPISAAEWIALDAAAEKGAQVITEIAP